MIERIHPAWWSPRVFPYVLVLAGLGSFTVYVAWRMGPAVAAVFAVPLLLIAGLLWAQLRLVRVVLLPGSITFPEWREEDASEAGVHFSVHRSVPRGKPDEVSVVMASAIRDWRREGGRIVLTTRDWRRHRIGLRGFRERDRERIVAWLVEKVGG